MQSRCELGAGHTPAVGSGASVSFLRPSLARHVRGTLGAPPPAPGPHLPLLTFAAQRLDPEPHTHVALFGGQRLRPDKFTCHRV